MAEGERPSLFADRGLRNYKSSPLLNAVKKNQASETSSLSDSVEAPKSYGTTRNPLLPQCDVKLIGHVLETTDTLQGLAIKYGVTVSKRIWKTIWSINVFSGRWQASFFYETDQNDGLRNHFLGLQWTYFPPVRPAWPVSNFLGLRLLQLTKAWETGTFPASKMPEMISREWKFCQWLRFRFVRTSFTGYVTKLTKNYVKKNKSFSHSGFSAPKIFLDLNTHRLFFSVKYTSLSNICFDRFNNYIHRHQCVMLTKIANVDVFFL